jgi:hypothetical protein
VRIAHAASLGPLMGVRQGFTPGLRGRGFAVGESRKEGFFYALELPQEPDEVQRELRIGKQGSYLLSVKNPQAGSPPSVGLEEERKAEFPDDLQERFGDRRFIPLYPPEFLDHEGAELLVMGSDEGPVEDLDIDLRPECETEETSNLFQELEIDRERHPVEPLLTGKWA